MNSFLVLLVICGAMPETPTSTITVLDALKEHNGKAIPGVTLIFRGPNEQDIGIEDQTTDTNGQVHVTFPDGLRKAFVTAYKKGIINQKTHQIPAVKGEQELVVTKRYARVPTYYDSLPETYVYQPRTSVQPPSAAQLSTSTILVEPCQCYVIPQFYYVVPVQRYTYPTITWPCQ